jgi:hypothetical protein
MAPRTRALLAAVFLLVATAWPAFAAVPSPPNSTIPACIVACPMGDIPVVVTVRDIANNTVPGSLVVLDFSSCPGAYICTGPPPDPYLYDPATRTIRMTTGANGSVSFPLRVGGGCGANAVRIYADGVLLGSRNLASPDQTANGMVICYAIDTDCTVFNAKMGGSDPTADFDCDGDVDVDDQITLDQHSSHACAGYIDPTIRRTWGHVKSIYR